MMPVYKISDADLQLIFDALQVAPLPYIKSHPLLQSLHDQFVGQHTTQASDAPEPGGTITDTQPYPKAPATGLLTTK